MNENMIKKRNKEKLNNKCIEKSFLKRVPECGVVAQYFYKVKKDEKENNNNNENENTKVIFEYFNVEDFSKFQIIKLKFSFLLEKFIFMKNKPNNGNGVLQRFLQPKGDYNCDFFSYFAIF